MQSWAEGGSGLGEGARQPSSENARVSTQVKAVFGEISD